MADAVGVRPLNAHEWRRYRDVRLAALLEDPDSFGQRYEDEATAPDDRWAAFIERTLDDQNTILVAEADGSVVGIASAGLEDSKGGMQAGGMWISGMWIGGMWVRPDHRSRGIGAALLEAALTWGRRAGASRVRLAVTTGNRAAERLYAAAGFEPTGETGTLRPGSPVGITWLERTL